MQRFFVKFLGANLFCAALTMAGLALAGSAQEIHAPSSAVAGDEITLPTTGSGKAAFYLVGPGVSRKSHVNLGEEIRVTGQDLRNAGNYLAILCSSTCQSSSFYVSAASPDSLAFLVHPSRVPVARSEAVSGVAFPFDKYHNLILTPETIDFRLIAGNATALSQSEHTKDGVAWFRTTSGKAAGTVQVIAGLGAVSARRALQEVASDPCNLSITAERNKAGIAVQTAPVHDCAGNVVSDGTIVTFTANADHGKSTVDAPIKQGVARAEIEAPGAATISVASGVVLGNEVRIGARP
jgi:hypothetical protein